VMGYSADGAALMVFDRSSTERSANMYRFDLATRKVTFWKAFGNPINSNGPPNFSRDGRAYYYVYNQLQSVGYVASGIK